MNLEKKKSLAARTLNIGRDRIIFNAYRLEEIKEAITKQDIKDLISSGAILIKEIKGRKKLVKRATRKRSGSKRKSIKKGKRGYIIITRKLRNYLYSLKKKQALSNSNFYILRKEIRARSFDSLAELKERIGEIKWESHEEED